MKITIICVGKIKEKFYTAAIAEYLKRLSRYCKTEIIELPDEKTPDGAGEALELQIKEKEGERILKSIKDTSYVTALAIEGKKLNSEQLASFIEEKGISGESHLTFIIGGSLGLAPAVLKRADMLLSFSDLTFPHQLMRVLLLEQIYRSYRIIHHEPYHK
ncbi:MAG: 23S rRNA (pseudouridine(1915)-N(3))-methyltransferase RlmH [Eubacteriales bacterium]|nr:23S rRNA (pseudouridine(1915)-N(3))-methyltransferase RlmH [Eubacteriales bacterium]